VEADPKAVEAQEAHLGAAETHHRGVKAISGTLKASPWMCGSSPKVKSFIRNLGGSPLTQRHSL
jgi:hypothetical protein